MQLDAHKSFSQQDMLQWIMSSRLVWAAYVIQIDDDQKLAYNRFNRDNMLIQTPSGWRLFPEKRGQSASLKEINQARFGMDNKFAASTVHGNLICVLLTFMEK